MSEQQRQATVQRMEQAGLVAIIRASSNQGLVDTCRALVEGGVTVAEITMTTPGALEAIRTARQELGDSCLIGVGSVLDSTTVDQAVEAGAEFVVSPVFKPEVVQASHKHGKPVLAGALTPTEILAAFEAGSDLVKVFPANHFGPQYFKDVLAPMPHLKLTPTGGVNLNTVNDWFAAGARCLGVGSALVKKDLIAAQDWVGLTDLASQFVDAVKASRQ
ncbi:bifunctional 4-hydroxy-2-oxoglutarate aldolase/2-dehydro-3-deoxy-phosphogluconate aldolase [Phycisphaerales bacterium AB-hyl4]|uniref:Bifunctional 4-hydroxy-2-oxoglutarate aldolase/2-dehydro-3-deoxy-phosphogluconate aldolase n=1 Tax=Natronomicrosphaera hydrolytica TaxID=3242702 RepID=A0ABV4U3Z6_9BACT